MNAAKPLATLATLLLVGLFGIFAPAQADEEVRLFDRQLVRVDTGDTYVDVSAADYTSWQALVTIAPDDNHALQDVKVVIDLDKATTGFADAYTTETLQVAIARKVDGTNWRTTHNLITPSSAIAASAADGLCLELDVGLVGPTEDVRIEVKLSAESTDVAFPFVVYYRSGASATVTAVSN